MDKIEVEITLAFSKEEYLRMCKEMKDNELWLLANVPISARKLNRILGHLDYYWYN